VAPRHRLRRPFGLIPAGGAEVPTFLAYGTEKQLAKRGTIRSSAPPAPSAASQLPKPQPTPPPAPPWAHCSHWDYPYPQLPRSCWPHSSSTACSPAPCSSNEAATWSGPLLASLFIGLVILVMINIPFASVWAKLLSIPKHYLYAGITVFSMLGVYAVSSAILDLWLLIAIGLVGFLMRRYNIPLAPVLIAVILGPDGRNRTPPRTGRLRRGPGHLGGSPITITLYAVLAAALVLSAVQHLRHRARRKV
jgi:putative tricarboxylic transport membrane protein